MTRRPGGGMGERVQRPERLVVAMTGATGVIYGVRLLETLRDTPVETHLVMSEWARRTIIAETDRNPDAVLDLAERIATDHFRPHTRKADEQRVAAK